MPTYDYHCKNCGHKLEVLQKITEEPLTKCPKCGKDTLHRGPGGGLGFSLQGSGWYKSGYASTPHEHKGGCCPCNKPEGSCDKPKPE